MTLQILEDKCRTTLEQIIHEQVKFVPDLNPILNEVKEKEDKVEEEGEEEEEEDDDDDDGLIWVIEEDRMYLADKRLLVCNSGIN